MPTPIPARANGSLTAKRDGGGRVHVLCASGARATLARHSLRQMGYDATVIEGGLEGWKKADLPLAGAASMSRVAKYLPVLDWGRDYDRGTLGW